jgi:hypothetical protein
MPQMRDWSGPVRVRSQDATSRVYLVHPDVRTLGETFRVYLLHLNIRSSCHGQARTSEAAAFRMNLLHLHSMCNYAQRARTRVDVVDSDAEGHSEFADKYAES